MKPALVDAAVALGANLGDRRVALDGACRALGEAGVRIAARSRLYWTRPWGVTDQPEFLNAAIRVWTPLAPADLLDLLLTIERRLGREREGARHWGPRALDLDLLLYGGIRLDAPGLTLPHPRIAERDFVLAPLVDLALPPDPAVAPEGWAAALAALPADARTILRSEPWKDPSCA